MNIIRRRTILLILIASTVLSNAWAGETASTVAAPQASGVLSDPVARVNGKEITAAQLKRNVDALIALQPKTKLTPGIVKNINTNMLESLISKELMYQAGLKRGVKDLDKQVAESLATEKAGYTSDEYYQKALQAMGMTENDFIDSLRSDIVIKNFITETIEAKITVSEEDCRKYYDQNIESFTRPEQVRVSHILIQTSANMSIEDKKKARDMAESLRKKILDGVSFVVLAQEYSDDPSKKLGGDLGYMVKKDLLPAFANAAFALKPGEMSEVVETRAGYHIIRMRDRRPSVVTPFADLKPQIEDRLKSQRTDAAVQKYLEEARKGGKIEVLLK